MQTRRFDAAQDATALCKRRLPDLGELYAGETPEREAIDKAVAAVEDEGRRLRTRDRAPTMKHPVIRKLRRVRSTKADGYHTLHFVTERLSGQGGNSSSSFLSPEHVPDFDGEEAWFELERVTDKPWPYWRAVRPVEPPPGRKPPEPVAA